MSDLDSSLVLSFGKAADTTDFATMPALVHLLPEKWGFRPPSRIPLARDPAHPLNKRFSPLAGPLDMSKAHELELIIRGLSGNTGATIDPETTNDIAKMLDVIFGTDSIDPAGAVTTATGGTGATPNLVVTSGTNIPDGMVIMFQAPLGTFHVRQVRSGGGTGTLVLDRTYSGTVESGTNVIRFARWKDDPAVHEHKHGFFRAEWANDRRDYKGGMSRATFDFSVGQYARLITSWMFSDIADAAEANPSFSEQTTGSALVNVANTFWIGSTAFYATDLKIELGGSVNARRASSGPQGIQGYIVPKGATAPKTRYMVKLHRGVNSGEIADSTGTPSVNSLQAWDKALGDSYAAFDIAAQVGTVAGACGYFPAQAASCVKCDEVVQDGYKCLDVEFECNGPTSTTFAPFEAHLG